MMPSLRRTWVTVWLAIMTMTATMTTAAAAADNAKPFFPKDHMDWGSYYDPQNVFCGKYDCYKILGFDYESFGSNIPDKKEITQRYRSLSREWHPDKSKHRDAKDRFLKISRAYQTLTSPEQRKEYDFMRYDQKAYFNKYGASVLWSYAPKSDPITIVIFLLAIGSALSWVMQKQKWQNVADRLIRACVEDWGPREGGTPESKEIRDKAAELFEQQQQQQQQESNGTDEEESKKKKKKLTGTERKKQMQEDLRPIIIKLVDEIHDFGAGFHKPTWRDLLIVKLVTFPKFLLEATWWNLKYMMRRLQKKELSDEERQVLTIRAVGEIAWAAAPEDERKEWIMQDLWEGKNMLDWEEAQEVKLLSASEQKKYAKMKKKGKKFDKDD